MDAPLAASDALIRPWRTATLVASLVAAVELVALVALAFLLLAKPLAHAVEHHAKATTATAAKHAAPVLHVRRQPPAVIHLRRSQTGVLVLNGNGRTGAAAAEAAHLRGLGYPITGTANAPRSDYATTSVLYRPGFRGEGIRLERDLGVHAIGPLDGLTVASLHGGKLAVILGAG